MLLRIHDLSLFSYFLHATVSVAVLVAQPALQVLVHGNVVVAVGTFFGQHPPGQPTVVVSSTMHWSSIQSGGGTCLVQAPANLVNVLVGHAAGAVVVMVWTVP